MPRVFHGWWIVAVAFAAQAVTIGLTIIPFGLFTSPLVDEFGLSIAEVQFGISAFLLVMAGASAAVGPLLDRYSIRSLMALGSVLLSLSFLGMSLASEPWQLWILFGLGAALGVALAGPLAATTVIAKWFNEKRGLAVGVAAMGPHVGGFLFTPLAGGWIADFGWRETLQIFAGISILIAPLAWLAVRNSPAEVGQFVDGLASAPEKPEVENDETGWTVGEILGNRNFWALALVIGIAFGVGGGWAANAPRFGEDLGYSVQHMSVLIGIGAGLGIPGTLCFGYLADRFDNGWLIRIVISLQIISFVTLASLPGEALFTAAILLFGLAGGGLLPTYASFIGRLFGPASFGSVMGLAGLVGLPFVGLAPIVAGSIRDSSGSYVGALIAFTITLGLGVAGLALIRDRRAQGR
ncbi:MAG: MFS transporter [Myxococcota bacterium]|nr:MFS transporter [Myxococcota bacterium]